ncbi:hypothetical protein Fcan01_09060 [Folsomia candida]|uniref:Uncharacterized protein n=1 Tax=Folsomia candida TaxID=158441 RepID=A0A226EED2_FOLCA|nr:hypothetical protein Fcan01_09060 [Folsomia candida]
MKVFGSIFSQQHPVRATPSPTNNDHRKLPTLRDDQTAHSTRKIPSQLIIHPSIDYETTYETSNFAKKFPQIPQENSRRKFPPHNFPPPPPPPSSSPQIQMQFPSTIPLVPKFPAENSPNFPPSSSAITIITTTTRCRCSFPVPLPKSNPAAITIFFLSSLSWTPLFRRCVFTSLSLSLCGAGPLSITREKGYLVVHPSVHT